MTSTAKDKTSSDAQPPVRVVTRIPRSHARLAEMMHTNWCVTASADLQPGDFENPALWAAMDNMKRGDRVEVQQSNRWTECIVWDHGPGAVFMRVLATVELPERGADRLAEIPNGYAIMRALPEHGVIGEYCVMRLKDGFIMNKHSGALNTYEEARSFLLGSAAIREGGKSYPGRG